MEIVKKSGWPRKTTARDDNTIKRTVAHSSHVAAKNYVQISLEKVLMLVSAPFLED